LVILAILLLCVMVGVVLHKRRQTADDKDPSYPTGGGVAPSAANPGTNMTTNATYQGGATTPPATPPADVGYSGASPTYGQYEEVDTTNDDGVYAEPAPVAPGGGLARKGSFC
jgi:hypothetical protein